MKKKLLAVILASAMALSLAACSGGGADSTSEKSEPAQTSSAAVESSAVEEKSEEPASTPADVENAQGVTDTQVIIANTAATSGAYAPIGLPFLAGIQGYLDMVNSEGGIDGREVVFIHKDDEFAPDKGKAYLQEMVEDEKVFAIVGHFGTPVVSATIEDLENYGIPAVYFATGIGQLFNDHATDNSNGFNIFPVQPLYITEGQVMVSRAVGTFGATKIGIIYTSDDAGKNMLDGAKKKAAEVNVELVEQQVAAGAADVSAAVTAIKDAGCDFVIIAAIQATMPTITKEMAAQGMTVPAITTYVDASVSVSEQIADEIAGKFDVYVSSWKTHDDEHADDLALFEQWVDKEYITNTDAESGWVAAHVFCTGLKRLEGKPVTWESYMAALEEAPIDIPFGGSISFANGARTGVQEMILRKCDGTSADGWTTVDGFRSMDELTQQ
ncbi:MAG: ABC transporter substrate-binding protein [Eubacterium sp.]|nr:ABC transporter substrate-binding protein [Eubacterium sp.]